MRISDWSSDVCSSDLDFVEIRKAEAKPAPRVVFAPAQKNLRLQGSSDALRRTFGMRPLVADDVVSTSGQQRLDRGHLPTHLRQILTAPAYPLQDVWLDVCRSAEPRGGKA